MNRRRFIKQIEPERTHSFDQHFWPVLVALCVLCSIAFGAILTLLRGPWMWGSMLILPAMAAVAIVVLYRLDNSRLRRSLQLAILISLAGHLAILILASVTNIFHNDYEIPREQIAKRPTRTIKVSNQRIPKIWERSKQKETPEPTVEQQRETPSTVSKPQPIPVKDKQPQLKPQITRRKTESQTVPRLDDSLSKLQRQRKNFMPRSSTKSEPQPAARTQPSKQTSPEQKIALSRRKSTTEIKRAAKQPSQTSQRPTTANQSTIAKRNTQAKSEAISRRDQPSTESTARMRRNSPRIPSSRANSAVVENSKQSPTKPAIKNNPSESASRVSRNNPSSRTARRRSESPRSSKPTRNENSQLARTAERRRSTNPAITNPKSDNPRPRRSNMNAPVVTSSKPVEAPSPTPESRQPTRQMSAKRLSVSRGEQGVAGSGSSRNMDRGVGGATSPAVRPSDSAARRRTESPRQRQEMLTPSISSTARRSIAQTQMPSSAFKANTELNAKLSGSKKPSRVTTEASAASIDASAAAHRSQTAASKGESLVDFGPTKIVPDQTAQRRSGGGQPEVAQLNPETTRRSAQRASDRMPTLKDSKPGNIGAPQTAESAPASSPSLEPGTEQIAKASPSGRSRASRESSSATEAADGSAQATDRLAEQLAGSRSRSDRGTSDSEMDEDEDDEELGGSSRSSLAQAPLVRKNVSEGSSRFAGGVRDSQDKSESESLASTVIERASGVFAGSLSRATASQLLGAAAAMPLVDSGQPSAAAERASRTPNLNASDDLLAEDTEARFRGDDRTPTLSPSAVESDSARPGPSESKVVMDASDVSVTRNLTSSKPGAAMEIEAAEGAAGLGELASESLGLRKRPASKESEQIQLEDETRFRRDKFGSAPAVTPYANLANEAFSARKLPSDSGFEPVNERAIELGLEFLARHQQPDGRWSLSGFDQTHPNQKKQLESDMAATGLALLAFQGAGYNHREFKYARQMKHALDWLIENQSEKGALYVFGDDRSNKYCYFYSHGIATLALTEAYGMTQDPMLRKPAQKAINHIVETQDPKRGGWRYYPQLELRKSDTSVTGWMMMALKSAQLSKLDVPQKTFDRIADWLQISSDPANPSLFRYNPYLKNSNSETQGRVATPTMTSVGLLMRIYSGWDRNDARLVAGAQYLVDSQLPSDATLFQRDTYYWYYATQVMVHVDGPLWKQWESQLHPLLLRSQVQEGDMAGSWDPYSPIPDRWGIHAGRLYVTAMNLLSLEVKNRKLPLYDEPLGSKN